MNRRKRSIRFIALTMVLMLMLRSTPIYAYWVEEIQSDWTITMMREVTVTVIGFSIEEPEESDDIDFLQLEEQNESDQNDTEEDNAFPEVQTEQPIHAQMEVGDT